MSRRRFAYTLGGVPLPEPVEVSENYHGGGEPIPVVTDLYMDGTRSPIDGSDIGSRAKRRAHMQAHGLVDADDYKQTWARAREAREAFQRTGEDGKDWGARIQQSYERLRRGSK